MTVLFATLSIAGLFWTALILAVVYAAVLPWLRRRRDATTSTPPGRPPG